MVRFGSLSDLAIKAGRPEYFPLDLGLAYDSKPANLHHHPFKGIKHKARKGMTPRYAMNDLNNFATFTAPQMKERAKFNAVLAYRKNLGSTNYTDNLETAYGKRLTAGATKPTYQAPTKQEVLQNEMSSQTTSTLQMFGFSKFEGSKIFDRKFPEYTNLFSKRVKSMFSNIVDEQDLGGLLASLYPSGIGSKRHTDEATLDNLTRLYRNEPEDIGTVQRAYDSASGIAGKKLIPQMEFIREEPEPESEPFQYETNEE